MKKKLSQRAYTMHLTGYTAEASLSIQAAYMYLCTATTSSSKKTTFTKGMPSFLYITFKAISKSPLIAITVAGAIAVHVRDNYI